MDRERLSDMLPLMQAFVDKKTIQYNRGYETEEWVDLTDEEWIEHCIGKKYDAAIQYYRVKPEEVKVPYNDVRDFIDDMKKHGPMVQYRGEIDLDLHTITEIKRDGVFVSQIMPSTLNQPYNDWLTWEELMDKCVWQDGHLCGNIIYK